MDSKALLIKLDIMADSVILYLNKPGALVNGVKTYISEERKIVPYQTGDSILVPVRFVLKGLGFTEELVWRHNENFGIVIYNGCEYAPLHKLCEMLSCKWFEGSGLLIISKQDLNISWKDNLQELRELCESFLYDDVTGRQITELVKERFPDCGHPRMIMTKERFDILKNEYLKGEQGDAVYVALFRTLEENCKEILQEEPVDYELRAGIRLMHVSDIIQTRCVTLALMYQITGNEAYAVRAREEMISACSFTDWHPYHFLDTGIMVCGLGLAYDWLYHWLNEEDRTFIRTAILEKGISQIMNDYDYKTIKSEDQGNTLSRTFFWNRGSGGNWVFASGCGVAIGALALCDELFDRELEMAERCLSQALLDIRPWISKFAPDGGFEEGVGYWNFACIYWQRYIGALITSVGSDFGYTDAPGLRQTNAFLYAVFGPAAKYGYHDVKIRNTDVPSGVLFWAQRFGKYEEAQPRIQTILQGRGEYHDLLFYDPILMSDESGTVERREDAETVADYLSINSGIFCARSSWKADAFWIAFHADEGIVKGCHRHSDGGSFALQAMGEEFFFDLGSDDYNLPDYRKTSYRCRAEGHNVLLINPGRRQYGEYDMQFAGRSKIDRWKSGSEISWAQANITDLWREDLERGWRGVKLYKKDGVAIVQDELVMKEPAEIYWFAHTRAKIEIQKDEKSALLTQMGKTLYVRIMNDDDVKFSVMEAKPLATSPVCIGQNENTGVSKLTIHGEETQNLRLVVAFSTREICEEEMARYLIPLTEW